MFASLTKVALVFGIVLGLTACGPSNPEDILKAGPEGAANFISEALANGDGEKLCDLINSVDEGSCKGLLDSDGLGEKPTPEVLVQFGNVIEYRFEQRDANLDRYFLSLKAVQYKTESGENWKYQITHSFKSIDLPFGFEYEGEKVKSDSSNYVMPGAYLSKVEILNDSSNWFRSETIDGETTFKITDKAATDMSDIVVSRCQAAQSKEAPTKENISKFADEDFVLTSITQTLNCENLDEAASSSLAPSNMNWAVASAYLVKGYRNIPFWGKRETEFTIRQGFSSTWHYDGGKWIQEDYDFYGN